MSKNAATKERAEKAPPKPKPIAQSTLTVHDDGKITGDFWIWEENEVGKRKKWTVGGEDFFRYIHRVQPKNVKVIASTMNVQVLMAGLPQDCQGAQVKRDTLGKILLVDGNVAEVAKSPGTKIGDRVADGELRKAGEAIGLAGADLEAAVTPAKKG